MWGKILDTIGCNKMIEISESYNWFFGKFLVDLKKSSSFASNAKIGKAGIFMCLALRFLGNSLLVISG